MRHFRIVIIDRVKGGFILQTEHEDHSINPGSELKTKRGVVQLQSAQGLDGVVGDGA